MNFKPIITKKKMKNLIIKVTDDGLVKVSAPKFLTNKEIQKFIDGKKEWIEERLANIEKHRITLTSSFNSGDTVHFLGEIFTLKIIISPLENIIINHEDKTIKIFCNNDYTSDLKKEIFYKYSRRELMQILTTLNKKYSQITGHIPTQIKIRKMKTLWGSCNITKKSITYNMNLIEKSIKAIEYVVLHEISHLQYPNHQKEFWNYIEKFMPDWKERKNLLKV
ncbi:M48 family metallopeptidase [Fusobacterium sp. PH5-44]|uniref:M48 family metallopeptidase n=1 Tax=unclassified Fusobacterium TaxID=2648384 RepID=UPI003D1F0A61